MALPKIVCGYEYDREAKRITVNCIGCTHEQSIEDDPVCMERTVSKLIEVRGAANSISLAGREEIEYQFDQTQLLVEIANLIRRISEGGIAEGLGYGECTRCYPERFSFLNGLLTRKFPGDPIGAYLILKRQLRRERIKLEKARTEGCKKCYTHYIEFLEDLKAQMEDTKLISEIKDKLAGYEIGDRTLYRELFKPTVRPNFMLTRYMLTPPEGTQIDQYLIRDIKVTIYQIPGVRFYYHIVPPEFTLPEEKYTIISESRRLMTEHKPRFTEFAEPERMRLVMKNIGADIIREMASRRGVVLSYKEIENLSEILARYTAGFGILEVLLADPKIQDIYINPPVGETPIYIFHSDYEECVTNLIPTMADAESWATRLKILSGRALDESNPVLDTRITVPGGTARVAAITRTISPYGLGFTLRRHRERPWTLPLFIQNRMVSPLAAGLLSFLVDGGRTILIGGTRSSGKTSLLGALMLEIMRKYRIVVSEDSVTSDSRILVQKNGKMVKTTMGELFQSLSRESKIEKENGREKIELNDLKVFAVDPKGKVKLAKAKKIIRHQVDKEIYQIRTSTGRKIEVTGDHSLFTLGKEKILEPIKVKELREGDFIAVPRTLNLKNQEKKYLNLLDYLEKLDGFYLVGIKGLKAFRLEIRKIAKELGYSKPGRNWWIKKGILPCKVAAKLPIEFEDSIKIKGRGPSKPIPVKIPLNKDFLTFVGLWLADGCYDVGSVIISVSEPEARKIVHKVADRLGLNVKMHSDGISPVIHSCVLEKVMKRILNLKGGAYTKEIPQWVYNLSKRQIAYVLNGIFSGDGHVSDKEIMLSLSSEQLLHDIQTLLLLFDIVLRIGKRRKDGTIGSRISALKFQKKFKEQIGILVKEKRENLWKLCSKVSTHDTSDIIPLPIEIKERIAEDCPNFTKYDYVTRGYNIGREKLKSLIIKAPDLEKLENLASSDLLWDKVVEIKVKKGKGWVYDLSVPPYENFVSENIIAHNTLELPVRQLIKLGYNVNRLKTRSVITRLETEVPAEEAIRAALRLGDSCLIVGEVRGVEARAMFEAMRIGAMANVVAGTIHGESAYAIWDRVVHDLGVPNTSFKAIDIIVVCNMLKSPTALKRFKRVVSITEVRKHWLEEPLEEGGFVDLMIYDAMKDELVPQDVLLNGDSIIIKAIMERVREWKYDFKRVWDEITLRAKVKKALVDLSEKYKKPNLLEAPFVVRSNEQFHIISDEVREEIGVADPEEIYRRWEEWVKETNER